MPPEVQGTLILADPAQGAPSTPAPSPSSASTATANPAPPTPPPLVTVTAEEYRRFLENDRLLKEVETAKQYEADAKEALRIKAMVEKGDAQKALDELKKKSDDEIALQRARYEALDGQILAAKFSDEITTALAGVIWLDAEMGPKLAKAYLGHRFESVRDPATGGVQVVEKTTRQPAATVIKAWLAGPEAKVLVKASSQGGSGGGGGTPTPDPAVSLRFDVQAVANLKAQAKGRDPSDFGIGRPPRI